MTRLWFGVVCCIVAAGVTVLGVPQYTRPHREVTVNKVEQEVGNVQHAMVEEVKQEEVDEVGQVADEVNLEEVEQKSHGQGELRVEQEQRKEEEELQVAGTEVKSEQKKQRSTIRSELLDEMALGLQKTLVEEASREVAKVVGTLLTMMMMMRRGKSAMSVDRGECCQVVLLHNSSGESFSSHLTQHLLK